MCNQCHDDPGPQPSRRTLLKLSAAALAGSLLPACQTEQPAAELATPYSEDHIVAETPGPPIHIDPGTIHVPPARAAPIVGLRVDHPAKIVDHDPLKLAHGRPMDGVKRITIHHSGDGKPFTATSVADVARHLQIVEHAHLQRGMIDIAYHFAVDRAGRLWQLRWLAYEGQHVRIGKDGTRWNEHNVGIVAIGDFNLQYPSAAQKSRLLDLVKLVKQKYSVPEANIKMHGELVQTDCPGKTLAAALRTARAAHQL